MPRSAARDPVYFLCVFLLVITAVGFFVLRGFVGAEVLRIRPATALASLLVALALAWRARGETRVWATLIGAIVMLASGVQLSLFVTGSKILALDPATQPVSQNFAAGMFCVGTALVIDCWLPSRWGRHLLLGLLGAIVAGVGILGLFGMFASLVDGFEPGPLRGMRLPSASILFFAGLGLLAGARLRSESIEGVPGVSVREVDDLRDRTGLAAALVMLLIALGATALIWRESKNHAIEQNDVLLDRTLDRLTAALVANALAPIALLDGLRGLFAASRAVEGDEWERYLDSIQLETRFPSIIAVAHVREIPLPLRGVGGQLELVVDGEHVRIWPPGDRAAYYPIAYITPKRPSTQPMLGFDIGADARYRATIESARASASATISERIDFARFNDPRSRVGFVVITPVDRPVSAGDTGSGFVYAAVDSATVVGKAITDADSFVLSVQVRDSASVADALFADADFDPKASSRSATVEIAGRSWDVLAQPRAMALAGSESGTPNLVLLGGSICALALFAITWVLAGHRARALHLAATMTTELRKSQRAQQAVTDTANAGIITADSDGNILYMNPSAAGSFTADATLMVGQSLTLLMPERFRSGHLAGLARVRDGGPRHANGKTLEMAGLRGDGSEFPIEILLSIWSSEGQMFFTAFVRDVTQRRQAQLQLEQKTRELERSNADLEQFAYVASHDLQEPLRMVASYVQLLSRRYRGRLDSDADEFIGFAVDGASRMQHLIQDLLAYARLGRAGKQPIVTHVGHCAETATAYLQEAIVESGARVHIDADCDVIAVPSQLVQLFQNLITNALKFRDEAVPEISITAVREDDFWHVRVRDNGIGIEPQHRERVFAIFQRLHTRKEYPGTGIGLAICRKIVEGLGGRIWVECQPGAGSVFHFTLPVLEENA